MEPKKNEGRRTARKVWQAAVALILVLAILGVFSYTSLAETHKPLPQMHLTAEELLKRNNNNVSIAVVYSEDSFAKAAAEELAARFNAVEGLHADAYAEIGYFALSSRQDLVIFLGNMRITSDETYLAAYRRLGAGGLELRYRAEDGKNGSRVDILAFTESQMRRGIEKFASYFLSTGGTFGTIGTVFSSEENHTEGEVPELQALPDSTYRSCTVAYPGADGYSLRALGTLTRELHPDTLVFWGVPDLGYDRTVIAESWAKVIGTAVGSCRNISVLPVSAVLGAERAGITEDILPTLLPDGTGVIRRNGCRFLLGTDGEPMAAEYWLASAAEEDVAALLGEMQTYSALLRRALTKEVPQVLYLPAVPTQIAAHMPTEFNYVGSAGTVFLEPYDTFVSSSADLLYRTARSCGIADFVCNAGYNNVGVVEYEENSSAVRVGFCGSVGFQNPGVGGKFALNNSLRGVLSFTVRPGENGEPQAEMQYVRASAYGLTEKNAGE